MHCWAGPQPALPPWELLQPLRSSPWVPCSSWDPHAKGTCSTLQPARPGEIGETEMWEAGSRQELLSF